MNLIPRYPITVQDKSILTKSQRSQKPILRSRNGSRHDPLKKSCLLDLQTINDESSLILPIPSNLRSQSNTNRRGTKDLIIKKNLRDIRFLMPITTTCENLLSIKKIPNSQILRDSSRRHISSRRRPLMELNEATTNIHQPKQKSLSPLKSNYTRYNQDPNATIEINNCVRRDLKTIDYVLGDLDFTGSKKSMRIAKNKRETNLHHNQDDFGLVSARERRNSKRCFEVIRLEKNYFKSSPVSLLNLEDETPCFGPQTNKFTLNIPSQKSSHSKILSLNLNLLKPPTKIRKNILTPKIASLNQIESSRQSDLSIDESLIINEYEQNKARLKEFAQGFRKKIFENTLKLPKRRIQITPLLRLKLLNRKPKQQTGKLYG